MSYQMDSTEIRPGTLKLHVGYKESDKLRGDSLVDRMRMPNWVVSWRDGHALRDTARVTLSLRVGHVK